MTEIQLKQIYDPEKIIIISSDNLITSLAGELNLELFNAIVKKFQNRYNTCPTLMFLNQCHIIDIRKWINNKELNDKKWHNTKKIYATVAEIDIYPSNLINKKHIVLIRNVKNDFICNIYQLDFLFKL